MSSTKIHIHHLLENIKFKHPKNIDLVIDGGAFNGFYTLGGLMYLKEMEKKKMIKIHRISGCSVGSILGTLYLCDNLDLMVQKYKSFRKCLKENRNLNILHQELLELVNLSLDKKNVSTLNDKLYINYYNLNEKKHKIVSTYNTPEELVESILKSSFLPLIINGNITYKDAFIDGLNPYIFKDRKRKIIFMKGFTLNPGKTLSIYNEKNAYSRVFEGIIYMHYFFLEKKTKLCCYLHKWSKLDLLLFRLREMIALLIVYFIYYSKKIPIPMFIKDLHLFNKIKELICYLVDDSFGILLRK